MLATLFGNRNIERILLFLFVNEKCYGSQLQHLLRISLTPVQKGLLRLEKASILLSQLEGKTRVYRFNPQYPLRQELESLLKTAYTLLPSEEKRKYCFLHKPRLPLDIERIKQRRATADLTAFWKRLLQVKTLSFSAQLKRNGVMEKKIGKGEVVVSASNHQNQVSNHERYTSTALFQEKGYWLTGDAPDTSFTSTLRWTLDQTAGLITLEHLRYGPSQPVFLFHLAPTKPFFLESIDAHLCGGDTYLGNLTWSPDAIDFHWRVIGPSKNDLLTYTYL